MSKKVLVTGGAGFIGSHLVDALLDKGYSVRVLDNLDPQVHGENQEIPKYTDTNKVEFIKGDIRDKELVAKALKDIQIISHQASAVGVGQSMYDIQHYMGVNTYGTAILLDLLANQKHSVERLVVASSMSAYGEGEYECASCGTVYPTLREPSQLENKEWEVHCPYCGKNLTAVPTKETKPLYPTSFYAISKKDQEEMFLCFSRAYDIPTVALRYFNVYGPRQALSNPYTGVAAIFSSRLLNNNTPIIYEDGRQSRDFTHVKDIIQANLLALENENANYKTLNVGTGRKLTVLDIMNALTKHLSSSVEPQISSKFREGDIRHCYADISEIEKLGYHPSVEFEEGVSGLVEWVAKQSATDKFDHAAQILETKGLAR